ncbi:hypothetical protein JCM3766R1_007012 [Sporobolomyces carnicolor]
MLQPTPQQRDDSVPTAESAAPPDDAGLAPPRLPSISSLLNSLPPPPAERNGDEVDTPRERHPSNGGLQVERTESPASSLALPPPPPPTNLPPPPGDYGYQLPYDYGARSPHDGGSPHGAVSPTIPQNSIQQQQPQNFAQNRSYYQQLPVFDSAPGQDQGSFDPHRQRSASFNTYPPYPPQPSQTVNYGRPYPGFATSSERRSSGSDERAMSHGGLGPWRNRRRGAESSYEGNGLAFPPSSAQTQPPPQQGHWLQPHAYSSTRQRALSISTTDEYYASRPAWSSIPPSSAMGPPPLPPPAMHTEPYAADYMHRPFQPTNSFNRSSGPLPGGVSNDFSYLRLGPPGGGGPGPEYSRTYPLPLSHPHSHSHPHPPPQQPAPQAYVPPALPIPPPLAPTPIEAHPDLRPIVLPSGLAGSAPSSAGSASASHYSSSQSGTGLPTPASAGPTSSIPSPNMTASSAFDLNGHGQADAGADGSGSTESGKYCCPHCSKRFARPSSLRIHTFSHTGEKPFTCPQCERAFSVQSNLRRHLKIHKNAAESTSGAPSRGRSRTAPQSHSSSSATLDSHARNGDMEDDEDAEGERDD